MSLICCSYRASAECRGPAALRPGWRTAPCWCANASADNAANVSFSRCSARASIRRLVPHLRWRDSSRRLSASVRPPAPRVIKVAVQASLLFRRRLYEVRQLGRSSRHDCRGWRADRPVRRGGGAAGADGHTQATMPRGSQRRPVPGSRSSARRCGRALITNCVLLKYPFFVAPRKRRARTMQKTWIPAPPGMTIRAGGGLVRRC